MRQRSEQAQDKRQADPPQCVGVERAAGDLYGTERLRTLVKNESGDTQALGTAIRADVRQHAGSFPQNDDITLMVFGRNAE